MIHAIVKDAYGHSDCRKGSWVLIDPALQEPMFTALFIAGPNVELTEKFLEETLTEISNSTRLNDEDMILTTCGVFEVNQNRTISHGSWCVKRRF